MTTSGPELISEPVGNISPRDIGTEMRASYIDYSMSVIVGRALPDVRDGLKPVHRRVLFAMHRKDSPPIKNIPSAPAWSAGHKKYHPHGDSAVYDALVRMVQDFSLLHPLIDGQGNFGSVESPGRGMRYTEAASPRSRTRCFRGIDQETVDVSRISTHRRPSPSSCPRACPTC